MDFARDGWCAESQQAMDHCFPKILTWRGVFFENCTVWTGLGTDVLFRKIDLNFGSSTSWNTQPNRPELFNIATAPSSLCFFGFLLGWPSASLCRKHALIELASRRFFAMLASGRLPRITRWFCALTMHVVFARLSSLLPGWTAASETLSSRIIFTILTFCDSEEGAVFGVHFPLLVAS